jgi:hypothetical protein
VCDTLAQILINHSAGIAKAIDPKSFVLSRTSVCDTEIQ